MEHTAAITINSLTNQIIGQRRKYHNILQISIWLVQLLQYLLVSAQFARAMHRYVLF